MIPSPFDVARETSNNLTSAFNRVRDENAIEKILSDAMSSNDPEMLQNSIGRILSQVSPERQGLAVQYLQNTFNNIEKKKQEDIQKKAAQEGGYTYGAPSAVQAQQIKNQLPSKASGGLSGQPVPQDISDSINKVLQENSSSNSDELAQAFDIAKVPRTYSNSYIENRRRKDETKATNEREDKQRSRQETLQFHKETEKFDEDLMKQGRIAKRQIDTIDNIEKSLKSGKVKPSSWANVFKGFGKIGDKISEALLNENEATLLTSIPQLLEGWKDVFGIRLSDADLRILQDKLPSIGKSESANKSVIRILKKYAAQNLLRNQIADQIKSENNNLRPLGYASLIEKRFDEMTQPIKIIRPKTDRVIEIPAYQLSDALNAGAKLADE